MDYKDIKNQSNKVKLAIRKNRLYDAIYIMNRLCHDNGVTNVLPDLARIKETYQFMLHYMLEGVIDNHRQKVYNELIEDLYRINDQIECNLRKSVDSAKYFSELRMLKADSGTLTSLIDEHRHLQKQVDAMLETDEYSSSLMQQNEQNMTDIFNRIWLTLHLQNSDVSVIADTLSATDVAPTLKSLIISALFLGLTAYYDSKKLILLLDAYQQYRDMKSLVAAVIIMAVYNKRVAADAGIKDRIDLLSFQDHFIGDLKTVILNLIKTRDTERINKKMKDEVIPKIMKLQPKIINRLKELNKETEVDGIEENPEWQEMLDKSGISDKLKELTDMQMDGGDVMMVAFTPLKHFPFFRQISNWFLPFNINHSELSALHNINNDKLLSLMHNDSVMCDSDKYSFALSIASMPEVQRNMMCNQMDAQFAQLDEERRSSLSRSLESNTAVEATKAVRDFYRFFKLYSRRADFYDPFKSTIEVTAIPFISDLVKSTDILSVVAEFYFTRGYHAEARHIYECIIDNNTAADAATLQKIGFCYQSEKDFEKALEYYHKSELISPAGQWLLKKIAACYKQLHRFDDAITYYRKALENDEDNVSLLLQTGHCLLQTDRIAEALQYYYKVEYLDEDGTRALRPIAWCEFVSKHFDKSLYYYQKIDSEELSGIDMINIGHLYLVQGRLKDAVNEYASAMIIREFDYGDKPEITILDEVDKFSEIFNDDLPQLRQLGMPDIDIPLFIDAVASRISEFKNDGLRVNV